MRGRAGLRALLLLLGLVVLAVVAAFFPLRAVPSAVAQLGPTAPVAGVVIFGALLVALVPRTPISLACGLLFGPLLGSACAIASMMVGAAATFVIGRRLGRAYLVERVEHGPSRLHRAWERIEGWIAREGVLAVAAVRSWPLGPFALTGYAYGTSNVRVRDYALGTLIASTPSAVLYAVLGAAASGAGRTSGWVHVLLPFGLILTLFVAWRTRAHTVNASPS